MIPEEDLSQYEVMPIQEDLSQYEVKSEEPSMFSEAGRIGGQLALRAGESILGFGGDVRQLLGHGVIAGVEKFTGKEATELRQRLEKSKEKAPPSATVREKGREIFGEKFEPKSPSEEFFGEIAGMAPLGPGKGILQKIAVASLGKSAEKAAKEFGGEATGQISANIVGTMLASRFGKPNVKDYIASEYKAASQAIPKDALRTGKRIESYLETAQKKVNEGGYAPWKTEVNSQIDALKKNVKNGAVSVKAIDQSVKDINSHLRKAKVDPQAERWLIRLKTAAQHELRQYGKQNPEFLEHYQKANAAFAGYSQSKKASDFISKHKKNLGIGSTVSLVAEFAIHGPESATKTIGALGAAYGIGKSAELLYRIQSNPTLFKYYTQALAAAAAENTPVMIENFNKLDEKLKEEAKAK